MENQNCSKRIWTAAICSVAFVVGMLVIGGAYKYKYHAQETIVVTGLGEEDFTSDFIVWRGNITAESQVVSSGYAELESNKQKVTDYITKNGIAADEIVFMFVNVNKNTESVYSNGNYIGQRFTGYSLNQQFSVESSNVEKVENISREISSLIMQGVSLDSWQPDYYYTGLDGLKIKLIEKATDDARTRAEAIAAKAGGKLGKLKSAKMGVFQITGANSNEEFSAGGSFNTSSKNKKARITMRLEYIIK